MDPDSIPPSWTSINKATSRAHLLNIFGVLGLLIILLLPLWLFYIFNNDFIPLSDKIQFIILIVISFFGLIFFLLTLLESINISNNNENYPKFFMVFLEPNIDVEKVMINGIGTDKIKSFPKGRYLSGRGKVKKMMVGGYTIFIMNSRRFISDFSAVYVGPINHTKDDYRFLREIDDMVYPYKKNKTEGEKNIQG